MFQVIRQKYQLKNDDYNVKQLRKDMIFQTNKAPKLLLKVMVI